MPPGWGSHGRRNRHRTRPISGDLLGYRHAKSLLRCAAMAGLKGTPAEPVRRQVSNPRRAGDRRRRRRGRDTPLPRIFLKDGSSTQPRPPERAPAEPRERSLRKEANRQQIDDALVPF